MGRDKASLDWQGRPLLDHLGGLLRAAGASALHISGQQADGRGIPDCSPDSGPLGGLASALPRIDDGALLVMPVDLPLFDPALLDILLDPSDAPACRFTDHPLPLMLRIDQHLREQVATLMQQEPRQRSLNRLFHHLHGTELPCPAPLQASLLNCNTPQEWALALGAQPLAQCADGGRSSTSPSSRK